MSKQRVIRKKGDLSGASKGDWFRIDICDEKYKRNYDKIFGKRNLAVENKLISDEKSNK